MSRSILSPVLTLNSYNHLYQDHIFDFDGTRGADIINPLIKWFICQSRLKTYFEVPKGTTKVQFRAYSEPGRGRTKMEFITNLGEEDMGVSIDGELPEVLVFDTQEEIKKLAEGRKTWYVNVYYWE